MRVCVYTCARTPVFNPLIPKINVTDWLLMCLAEVITKLLASFPASCRFQFIDIIASADSLKRDFCKFTNVGACSSRDSAAAINTGDKCGCDLRASVNVTRRHKHLFGDV